MPAFIQAGGLQGGHRCQPIVALDLVDIREVVARGVSRCGTAFMTSGYRPGDSGVREMGRVSHRVWPAAPGRFWVVC
jgi:hypothetical protein